MACPDLPFRRNIITLMCYCISIDVSLLICILHAISATMLLFYFCFIAMDACHVPRSDPMQNPQFNLSDLLVRVRFLYSALQRGPAL